ncbi:hypothetical protein OKW21_006621 [Catalinimonas alkaloidigena]|uniref:hypothetical protein n=1 Tax=Catalinimonas alkaloidigena TaxID=1075417 RepID=UPI002406702F|nr:hypothetical protein [Catalinimonas alkaloidigena]MDF9801312.1 hypothetical protein [Catalinimonas alkaloidigena]
MKKLICTLFSLGCFTLAEAQLIVVDPGDIAATIANGGILAKTNSVIKDANEIASDIKNTVQNIRELQQTIDDALWEVKALIKSDKLGISNIQFEMDATAQVSTDLNHYVSSILPGDHPMIQGYGNASTSLGSEVLHQVFGFDFDEKLPDDLPPLQNVIGNKLANREIFAYASARKSIQIALTYNQVAEVMLTKAEQLNELLHKSRSTDGENSTLKMNEADRIQLLETTASYVRKALELRLMCDQLIEKEISREAPVQQETLHMYQQYTAMDKFFGGE